MERTASALDFFEDVGGAGRPDKGFGVVVVAIDVIAEDYDHLFEIAKHSTAETVLRKVAEETSTILSHDAD